jgi:hypothetical protein
MDGSLTLHDDLAVKALELAAQAQYTINSHEKVCGERQLAILNRFEESRAERAEFRAKMDKAIATVQGVLWKAAVGIIAALASLTVTLVLKLTHLDG